MRQLQEAFLTATAKPEKDILSQLDLYPIGFHKAFCGRCYSELFRRSQSVVIRDGAVVFAVAVSACLCGLCGIIHSHVHGA